jgi:hypothetical protein
VAERVLRSAGADISEEWKHLDMPVLVSGVVRLNEFEEISANCCREDIQLIELIAREEEVQVLGGVQHKSSIWLESAGQKRTYIRHSVPSACAGASVIEIGAVRA